jgi:hypothetical protein
VRTSNPTSLAFILMKYNETAIERTWLMKTWIQGQKRLEQSIFKCYIYGKPSYKTRCFFWHLRHNEWLLISRHFPTSPNFAYRVLLAWLNFRPWGWGRHDPPKSRIFSPTARRWTHNAVLLNSTGSFVPPSYLRLSVHKGPLNPPSLSYPCLGESSHSRM